MNTEKTMNKILALIFVDYVIWFTAGYITSQLLK